MKRAVRIVAVLMAISLVAYFLVFSIGNLDLRVLVSAVSSPGMVLALLVAAIAYACIIPITGRAWGALLASRGESWSTKLLIAILGLSQLAKYVPGNVAQHVARATISMRHGMRAASLFATVAQETVLAVAASLVVGLVAWVATGRGIASLESTHVSVIAVASMVLVCTLLVVVLISRRSNRHRVGAVGKALSVVATLPRGKTTCYVLLAYSLNYVLIGAGLWLVANALESPGQLTYSVVTAAFALSWLLGFATPGAPAGLGTREGIMLLLLRGTAEDESLLTFVLLARVVTMLGDIISFIFAALLLRLGTPTEGKA